MELVDILFIIVFWVFWYGSMLLIGYFLESRIVPLWKHQSRAYFPGDLALPVMMVGIYRGYKGGAEFPKWVCSPVFAILVGFFVIIMAYIVSKKDRENYSFRAANSPTKKWHDFVGYYICSLIIIEGALPLVAGFLSGTFIPEALDASLFIGGLVFYGAMVVMDWYIMPATPADIEARHPSDWKPRWRKEKD